MTAGSLGLRVSNSSTTRGRPPVMSFVLVVSRGIFASTSPGWTSSPSATIKWARDGMRYFFRARPAGSRTRIVGWWFSSPRGKRHDQLRESRDFVHLFFDCDPRLQVFELDRAAGLGEDREGIRIPFDHGLAERDRLAIFDLEARAVDNMVAFLLASLFIHNGDQAGAVHRHDRLAPAFDHLHVNELHEAVVAGLDL